MFTKKLLNELAIVPAISTLSITIFWERSHMYLSFFFVTFILSFMKLLLFSMSFLCHLQKALICADNNLF